MAKKVIIAGFAGAMGQKAVRLVNSLPNFEISAGFAPYVTRDPKKYHLPDSAKIYEKLNEIPDNIADLWIDFTTPTAVYDNVKFAINHKINPIVGTTGITDEQEKELQKLAAQNQVGGLIAPNFGLSAVLLMKFAQTAAKYFPDVEIIEMHHADKKDAPSGSALRTAKLIAGNRPQHETAPKEIETLANVRGGDYQGIKIHSVRLPGYIAHEQVLFGGKGEALTLRQDSFDRNSFMTGVKLALGKVSNLDHLVIGLENLI